MVVEGAKPAFDGAVGGILGGVYLEGGEGKIVFQQLTKVLAEVGHGLKAGGMALPDPLIDLPRPELFLSKTLEILL